jgi:hypothetical protein
MTGLVLQDEAFGACFFSKFMVQCCGDSASAPEKASKASSWDFSPRGALNQALKEVKRLPGTDISSSTAIVTMCWSCDALDSHGFGYLAEYPELEMEDEV